MRYNNIKPARFLERPNRFIAICRQGDELVTAHVKHTGRCAELFVPEARVWLDYSDNPARKTPCDLVSIRRNDGKIFNVDSQSPNKVVLEGFAAGRISLPGFGVPDTFKSEHTYGSSRFDFYVTKGHHQGFVEVKGVTLEENGAVYFPDAPTVRGTKHIRELEQAVAGGYYSCILFLVQFSTDKFLMPKDGTDPEFGIALRQATANGVATLAWDCAVTPQSIDLKGQIEIRL